MGAKLSKWILDTIGWKVTGHIPNELNKCVMVVMPHTSNWDFPIGILVRSACRLHVNFVAKSSLFKPPFGWIFYNMGGYPVDRSKNNNFVDSVAKLFRENERFSVVMTPEGTRSKVSRLKTGFYHLAKAANVPIVLIAFDFVNKTVDFKEPFMPDATYEQTYQRMKEFYKGIQGKNPELGYEF